MADVTRSSAFTRRHAVHLGALVFLVLMPPVALVLDEPFYVSLASRILIYGLAAASLDLILGFGGMVSFGHAAFFGTGGYVVGILFVHGFEGTAFLGLIPGSDSGLIVWPAAAGVAGLLALIIGSVSLRTGGVYFIMITLAFAQMLYFFFVSLEAYGGDDGLSMYGRSQIPWMDLSDDTTFYYVCLAVLLLFLGFGHRAVGSRFGMVIRGVRENERRMTALGFPTYRYKLACFSIAGAAAGLAGALIANQTEFVSPSLMHWTRSGEIMVMVILGGMGTLFGPVFGAAAFLLLEEVLSAWTEHWMIVLGPVLIFVVLFARRGIYGWLIGAQDGSES
ncbi:MAG: branched-chain amino acid ABC transporter permease [Rhodospirillales bacterium]|nr:MAG: branched-chain amino acid ABC transporter permease [Rhodospirillales bacterium]